ncbi:MAG: hypothetical protein RIQ62_520 [Bacteroidota bacterium]|jgi:hypothetical protein
MKKLYTFLLVALSYQAMAGTPESFWTLSDNKTVAAPGERKIIPSDYLLAQLDVNRFQLFQSFVSTDMQSQTRIVLPAPDGTQVEFRLFEYPMMEAPLAAKYPQIKTYTAIKVGDERVIAKVDFTVFGLHAMVLDGDNTWFIDPYTSLSNDWYVVYYKKNYRKKVGDYMHCELDETTAGMPATGSPISLHDELPNLSSYKTNGNNLRNYRLALACTEEYSTAVGGATPTKASVLSAMVTSMNRVNGVFEKEFSMHANLVGNNDTLIFLPGSGDPYTNNSGSTMLGQNQTTCNNYIGSANYDFGHVFSTGGGGVAQLACVCGSSKARGVTGSSNPVGDAFDIDYVAHEMGHQFGGNHTFNSVSGSCSGNRSSTSAYEIGSATTIMGYAGICNSDDIQPHSDDYYHVISLEQMTGTSVMACATTTASGNTPPVLAAINKTWIVPYKTDFELTTTATDANNDSLTYCWEEYDRGGSGSAWDAATTVAPIIRSFNPMNTGYHVYPKQSEMLKNTIKYLGERLPDTTRTVRFRCTVRDMHNGHGAFYTSTDTTKLDVRKTTSLFRVTSQNTVNQQWMGFSSQTVTWDVAGTDASPFSAAAVDIYLSVDSGKTFTYPLVLGTPNDGSQVVGTPNLDATYARVKVKASGNIWFDLNDEWIQIKKVVSPNGINEANEAAIQVYPNPAHNQFTLESPAPAQLFMSDVLGHVVLTQSLQAGANTISTQDLAAGAYLLKWQSADGSTIIKKITCQ